MKKVKCSLLWLFSTPRPLAEYLLQDIEWLFTWVTISNASSFTVFQYQFNEICFPAYWHADCFLSFSLKLFSECIISKKKKKKCVAAFYLPRQQNFHKYITPHLWNKGRIPCLNKEETPVLLQIVLDRSGPGVLNIVILFSEQQYVTLILSLFMYKAILRLIIAMH